MGQTSRNLNLLVAYLSDELDRERLNNNQLATALIETQIKIARLQIELEEARKPKPVRKTAPKPAPVKPKRAYNRKTPVTPPAPKNPNTVFVDMNKHSTYGPEEYVG